jgi:hypothetical protein
MEGWTDIQGDSSFINVGVGVSIFCFRHVHIDAFIDLFLYIVGLGSGMVFIARVC